MSQKTVLYFLAGPAPTVAEAAELAILNSIASAPYVIKVLNGKPKASLTGITLSAAQSDNSFNDAGATITATDISALASDNSFNDASGGFVTAGFQVDDVVTVTGFTGDVANNIVGGVVTALTASKMTIGGTDGNVIVNDDAGESVTIAATGRFLRRGFAAGNTILARGFTGNVANNLTSGVISSVTATKMIIAGAAGDLIVDDAVGESVTICTVEKGAEYGSGVIVADYVAGTVPQEYQSTSRVPIYDVLDPANPPDAPTLVDTQTVLSDAEEIELDTAGTVTVTVADGEISAADVAATEHVVTHADTLTVAGSAVTFGVSGHALTGTIPATKAIIADGAATTVSSKPITLAVATNTLGVGTLTNSTDAVLSSGATVAVGSGTATLTIANRALASAALDATHAVVATTQEIAITSGTGTTKVTLTVAGGTITACVLS